MTKEGWQGPPQLHSGETSHIPSCLKFWWAGHSQVPFSPLPFFGVSHVASLPPPFYFMQGGTPVLPLEGIKKQKSCPSVEQRSSPIMRCPPVVVVG